MNYVLSLVKPGCSLGLSDVELKGNSYASKKPNK